MYYTPEIQDLYIGLECEITLYEDNWQPMVLDSFDFITWLQERLNKGAKIRIKYLDQEDIESIGFKFKKIEVTPEDMIEYYVLFGNDFTYLYFKDQKMIIEKHLDASNEVDILFKGTVDNKTEFIKLCHKQLDIKKGEHN